MDEGLETEKKSQPMQTAYRVGYVAMVGAALYTVGELAVMFPFVIAFVWMAFGLFVPTACVIGVLYSQGDQRFFCIGALFPAALILSVAVTLFVVTTFDPDQTEHFEFSSFCLPMAWFLLIGSGTLAVHLAKSFAHANTKLQAEESQSDVSTESTPLFWQFSLWALMIAMTVCAVICAIVFALPPVFSVVICLILWAVAPVFVTIALLSGSEKRRDFWIGAVFPTVAGFAAVTCVFVIVVIDDGPWFFRDNDLAIGFQIVTVLLGGAILAFGKLATVLGRRLRNLQDSQENL